MSLTKVATRVEWRVRNLDCENEAAQIRRGLEKLPDLHEWKIYSSAAKVAPTLVFLYSISEAAEGHTEERTRSAIRALMDLAPKIALVIRTATRSKFLPKICVSATAGYLFMNCWNFLGGREMMNSIFDASNQPKI